MQLGPLGSDVMFEVVEISDACFVHLLLQYTPHAVVKSTGFKSGEFYLEATVAAKWTLAFIFSWKRHFDDVELTSSLRSVVKVMMADYNIVEHGENNFTTQIRYKIVSSNNVCQLKSAETDNFYTQ